MKIFALQWVTLRLNFSFLPFFVLLWLTLFMFLPFSVPPVVDIKAPMAIFKADRVVDLCAVISIVSEPEIVIGYSVTGNEAELDTGTCTFSYCYVFLYLGGIGRISMNCLKIVAECFADTCTYVDTQYCIFPIIRRISLISAYSLLSACCVVVIKACS